MADRFQALLERQYTNNPLLFAMGDGNHSLATAKSCWLDIRKGLSEEEISNHPARWALVEVQNIYDPGIVFEPIHRLLFSIEHQSFLDALGSFCASYETKSLLSIEELDRYLALDDGVQRFGYRDEERFLLFSLKDPASSLAAGTIQHVIDRLLDQQSATVDYTHGEDVTLRLGSLPATQRSFFPIFPNRRFSKPSRKKADCRGRRSRWDTPIKSASTSKPEKSPSKAAPAYDIGKHACKKCGEQRPEGQHTPPDSFKVLPPAFNRPVFKNVGGFALFQGEVVYDLSFTLVAVLEGGIPKGILLAHLSFLAFKGLYLKKVLIIRKTLNFRFECSVVQVSSLTENSQKKEKCEKIRQ